MAHSLGRIALVGAGLYAARRYYRQWGATKEESQMTLPGDELVGEPRMQTTEAIWIDEPAGSVRPWLVQMARTAAAARAMRCVENLIGLQFHNADRIHPEWQRLGAGDVVRLVPKGWMGLRDGVALRVAEVIPEKSIVLRAAPA